MDRQKLERAYRAFVHGHQVVRSARTEAELFRNVCETAVNDLGFRLAWIGLAGDDFAVVPVAQAGYESGYLDSIRITWSDDVLGGGPTGRAIRERKPVIARCIATDERFAPWREDALRRGYASSAAIPLSNGAHCLGALNLYAAEPDAFDDDEIALLEELAA
ncbi:MAG: GAF domain-containing protein, partial [Sandaracinaceae bacterium]|nr:GAF domain-containing protein [Sandaracinaceae bacterium]